MWSSGNPSERYWCEITDRKDGVGQNLYCPKHNVNGRPFWFLLQLDVEAVLSFAEKLIRQPQQLWRKSSLDQKQKLQRVFFPNGVTVTSEGFGTAPSNSFFGMLGQVPTGKASLASPTGYSGEGEHRFRRQAERRSGMKVNSSRSEATLA